ncbi:MAG: hypothetical protein KatS3mg098_421 [Candidatus Parcubacteria bacterium]|nr:MAG: hypothetical protein KatS3mg098_421 [Candidatus Parcubacteria bacterium]
MWWKDFISHESREYKFKIGKTLASSLAGFVAGVVFASIVWIIALLIFR